MLLAQGDYWEMLLPSTFAEPTPALRALAAELEVTRRDDPLLDAARDQPERLQQLRISATKYEGGFADR